MRRALLLRVVAVVPAGAEITVGNDDLQASHPEWRRRSLPDASAECRFGARLLRTTTGRLPWRQRRARFFTTSRSTAHHTGSRPGLDLRQTVVKHEAFPVRKSSGRAVPAAEPLAGETDANAWTDERVERYERARRCQAMAGLKPQEIRCLLLKAEGLSYQEICVATGFSYTKVWRQVGLSNVTGLASAAISLAAQDH
jgi:DNA-binding CsgD family transcriptional regulator